MNKAGAKTPLRVDALFLELALDYYDSMWCNRMYVSFLEFDFLLLVVQCGRRASSNEAIIEFSHASEAQLHVLNFAAFPLHCWAQSSQGYEPSKSLLLSLHFFCIFEKSGKNEATDLAVSQLQGSIISAHVPGPHMWASAGHGLSSSSPKQWK